LGGSPLALNLLPVFQLGPGHNLRLHLFDPGMISGNHSKRYNSLRVSQTIRPIEDRTSQLIYSNRQKISRASVVATLLRQNPEMIIGQATSGR
jgi:hypothetical protein